MTWNRRAQRSTPVSTRCSTRSPPATGVASGLPCRRFSTRYPELADDLRELFPAMVEIEQVKDDRGEGKGLIQAMPLPALRQLGDYRILREVGRGGMGDRLRGGAGIARAGTWPSRCLPAHALLDPGQLQRFQREARSAARLHHTNIVPVFGVGEHDGLHYYVMQFIHGQGLDQVLEELRRLRQASTPGGQPAREPPLGKQL